MDSQTPLVLTRTVSEPVQRLTKINDDIYSYLNELEKEKKLKEKISLNEDTGPSNDLNVDSDDDEDVSIGSLFTEAMDSIVSVINDSNSAELVEEKTQYPADFLPPPISDLKLLRANSLSLNLTLRRCLSVTKEEHANPLQTKLSELLKEKEVDDIMNIDFDLGFEIEEKTNPIAEYVQICQICFSNYVKNSFPLCGNEDCCIFCRPCLTDYVRGNACKYYK